MMIQSEETLKFNIKLLRELYESKELKIARSSAFEFQH